jgi:hypothetical protein
LGQARRTRPPPPTADRRRGRRAGHAVPADHHAPVRAPLRRARSGARRPAVQPGGPGPDHGNRLTRARLVGGAPVRGGVVPGHGLPGPLVVGGERGRFHPGGSPAGLVGGPLARGAGRAAAWRPGPPAGEPPVPGLLLAVRGEFVRREGVDQQRVGRRRGTDLRRAARAAHAAGAVRERRQRRRGGRPDGRPRPRPGCGSAGPSSTRDPGRAGGRWPRRAGRPSRSRSGSSSCSWSPGSSRRS